MLEFEGRIGGFRPRRQAVLLAPPGRAGGRGPRRLAAPDTGTVDAFYAAALGAGAEDNGPPGLPHALPPGLLRRLRSRLPDGNNVEAVHHG